MSLNMSSILSSLLGVNVNASQAQTTTSSEEPKTFETDKFIDSIFEADADENEVVTKSEISSQYSDTRYKLMMLQFQKLFNPNNEELQERIDSCTEKLQILTVVGSNFETFSKNGTEDKIDADDVTAIRTAAETDGDADNFTVEDFETLKGPYEFEAINTNSLISTIISSDFSNDGSVTTEELAYKSQQIESQISYLEMFNNFFGGVFDDKIEALEKQLESVTMISENFTTFSKEGSEDKLDSADLVKIIGATSSDSNADDFSMDDLASLKNVTAA